VGYAADRQECLCDFGKSGAEVTQVTGAYGYIEERFLASLGMTANIQ
jgi:hypothetical protein